MELWIGNSRQRRCVPLADEIRAPTPAATEKEEADFLFFKH